MYKAINHLLMLPRSVKRLVALTVDVCLVIGTVALSFWIRLDEWVRPVGNEWLAYIFAIGLSLPLFVRMGLYRAIFRHAGFAMLLTIVYACMLYALMFGTILTLVGIHGVPRTIGVLQPLLLLLTVIASRVSIRALIDWRALREQKDVRGKAVIVYGAGSAGRQLVAAAAASRELDVVAFVDDDKTLQGGLINGLSIYTPDQLRELVDAHKVEEILLALPGGRQQRQQVTAAILPQIAGRHVTIRTLPSLLDLAHGTVTVSDLREIDIDDLLGRDPVAPHELLLARKILGKVVIVTGAGGSIGRELCRQIAAQQPSCLILVDVSEYNLYAIHRELIAATDTEPVEIVPLLATVQDARRMDEIIGQWRPNTIYHAAAYKHVPLVESNAAEGVANNVFGTLNVALAAIRHSVSDVVLVSTDKAVRPTNVMGATKRLAEQILQALAAKQGETCFSMVRFGNVLGSSGSVVPLFREQIKAGGPVTLTHSDVTRYFMTIPEAAQLVIQAGAMASGGEVFVLDMGEPVKIADLARIMIKLSGLTVRDADNPDGDIAIETVGMRPGEKLYEELLIGDDPQPTKHPRIMRANERFMAWDGLEGELERLRETAASKGPAAIFTMLEALVPEYRSANAWDRNRPEQGLAS